MFNKFTLGVSTVCLLLGVAKSDLDCNDALSCVDATVPSNETVVNCRGFVSCDDLNIVSNDVMLDCFGALSCVNIDLTNAVIGEMDCHAYYSCADYQGGSGTVWCKGEASCIGATVAFDQTTDSDVFDCPASTCCSSMMISSPPGSEVLVGGYYALGNSNLTSDGSDITMRMDGRLSGYELTVTCSSGDTCTVDCRSASACYEMSFVCETDATCSVNCDESNGIYCPNEYSTDSSSLASIEALISVDLDLSAAYDSEIINNYDNYYSTLCKLNDCIDYESCQNGTFDDSVISQGDGSGDALCFLGMGAGTGSTIDISSSYNVISAGEESLEECSITGGNNIYCQGHFNCDYCSISGISGALYCGGKDTCAGADPISNIADLFCNGQYSCNDAVISDVTNIYGFGGNCLTDATITSDGTLNVYLDGYEAGKGATITCNSDDVCTVYCFESAMTCDDDLTFTCMDGATCTTVYYYESGESDDTDAGHSLICSSNNFASIAIYILVAVIGMFVY